VVEVYLVGLGCFQSVVRSDGIVEVDVAADRSSGLVDRFVACR
jgi:hypothetical protein